MHASNCVITVKWWVNFLLCMWRLLYNFYVMCELRVRIVLHLQLTLQVRAATIVTWIIIVHIAYGDYSCRVNVNHAVDAG